MSLPGPGVLFVTIGSKFGSKKSGCIRDSIASSVSPALTGNRAPACWAARAAAAKACGVHWTTNLVRPGVDPKELRIPLNLLQRVRLDARRVRQDLFEHLAHLEAVRVSLVIVDVAPGKRRLVEMPDQGLLFQRQRLEPIRVQLDNGGLVYLLDEVLAIRANVLLG
jgi:hypothetical protein